MSEFNFDEKIPSDISLHMLQGKSSRADAIRNLVIEGADKAEATEFIDSEISEFTF